MLTVVEYGELIGSWPSSSEAEENGKLAGARIDTAAQLINGAIKKEKQNNLEKKPFLEQVEEKNK